MPGNVRLTKHQLDVLVHLCLPVVLMSLTSCWQMIYYINLGRSVNAGSHLIGESQMEVFRLDTDGDAIEDLK